MQQRNGSYFLVHSDSIHTVSRDICPCIHTVKIHLPAHLKGAPLGWDLEKVQGSVGNEDHCHVPGTILG